MLSTALRSTHFFCRQLRIRNTSSRRYLLTRGLAPSVLASTATCRCRNEVARDTACSATVFLPELVNASASPTVASRISQVKRELLQIIDEQAKRLMSVERRRLVLELQKQQQKHRGFTYLHKTSNSPSPSHRTFSSSSRHPLALCHPSPSFPPSSTRSFPLLLVRRGYQGSHHLSTRAELLAQANGTLHRIWLRVKLALMRQIRPWTLNDVTAMFSWIFVGQTVWLLASTTSFVSLVLVAANTLQFQEWIAYRISKYLTSASGLTIVFDSAIVPNWKEGKISFQNVSVSRMPRSERQRRRLERESGKSRVADMYTTNDRIQDAKRVIENRELYAGPGGFVMAEGSEVEIEEVELGVGKDAADDEILRKNMWFDLTVESVDVTLSFIRWLDGKGLVKDCEVKGVRGTIDRRHVKWDPSIKWDPVAARQTYHPGDFELETFHLEDILITIYQPNNFRPYAMSVFNADFSTFRKQWLMYDLLCANSVVGSFDQCLFSVHTPQVERSVMAPPFSVVGHVTSKQEVVVGDATSEYDGMTEEALILEGYRRKSRLQVDGVKIDHLNRGVQGPFGWITSATIDICADVYIPAGPSDSAEEVLRNLVSEITDRIELSQPVVVGTGSGSGEETIVIGGPRAEEEKKRTKAEIDPKFIMDLDIRFNDTKASVPLQPAELGYLSNAMIRPVVAYINRNKTIVPIKCRIVMDMSNFDGSWTPYDSTLIDRVSEQVGRGFVHLTADQQERNRRLKRVGLWGLQEVTRNLMSIYDYARGHRGFWHFITATA
ncbi:mitochondrial distribution and morphology protein-domain-containing protein [Jimgerdemannia flammicorona]|uniref:Mitochondrial distribution and morphology protein-domain-containing protein n=1 Tax=Jimgerdemannia flammicorona TaxID=994334 RepID=A0A433QZ62_9FUNG|nr:mitochondrial distribution and morphology protein-domain-containing protein [Jimgerdemannia flammicorona]